MLSVVLTISLAGNLIWPERSSAAAGAPLKISYEGRLTDSSGNALGGTGTVYCYRFSIYDSATSGTKLWPSGTPSNTTATTTDGVFNVIVGQADTLSSTVFDFSTTSTAYLQVEVNTTTSTCGGSWEALLPRQQILSTGYAMQSANVYGSLLKTDTTNNIVQIGVGGQSNPVELALDTQNTTAEYVGQTCSTSGYIWYNSVTTQALICENGTIQALGTAGTTTIAAITANSGTPATAGTINFSNSNGVSFGINGNTITASVNAGGAGATVSRLMWPPMAGLSAVTAPAQGTMSVQYFPIFQQLTATRMDVAMSISVGTSAAANTAGVAITQRAGLYSLNGATLMSIVTTSHQQTISWASNSGSYSSITGRRLMSLPININATPGDYYVAYYISTAQTSMGTATTALSPVLSIFGGTFATAGANANDWGLSATSRNVYSGMGVYSAQVNSNLGNLSLSAINATGVNVSKANIWIQFRNI